MNRTLDDIIADIPEQQQAEVQALYEKLRAEELTLQQLRKAKKLAQDRMAELLDKPRGIIPKIER